jgi:tRNA A-37 threonylcarbamoyl transferase component Bud32
VITLTLLHPLQSTPIQSWTFDQEARVSVGRSTDNHVVLYSAVVSRHHVELCCENSAWEVVSLGANGTYVDGQRITRLPLKDGSVFRLARSGPNLQVNIHTPVSARSSAPPLPSRSPSRSPSIPSSISQPQSASSDAFALASERISKILEDEETSVGSGELLFDTQTGLPLKTVNRIGIYQILKTLGQGPMAITYLVWHNGQTFVLKQLNAQWSQDPRVVEAFHQQFRSLQTLQHPGIPRVTDLFTIDNQPTVVMEMVYGQTLADLVLERGPVALAEAIALVLEICDVLEELHNGPTPIVHGDLHPRHLLRRQVLRSGQEIVLIDFGNPRWQSWQSGLDCQSKGYTAPELKTQAPTPATDVYALGTTLAHLLTGEEPRRFYASDRFHPESMGQLNPAIIELLQHMTDPNPRSRPPVSAIAQMLRQMI